MKTDILHWIKYVVKPFAKDNKVTAYQTKQVGTSSKRKNMLRYGNSYDICGLQAFVINRR